MKVNPKRLLVSGTLAFAIAARSSSTFAQEHGTQPMNSKFDEQMMQSMEIMDKEMMAAPMIGDPDRDFCAMMIPHHQGAIDMAKAVLLHGNDPIVRRLAQEIIVTQTQEIEVMRRRLSVLSSTAPIAKANPSGEMTTADMNSNAADEFPVSSHDRVYTADQTSDT